MPVLSKPSQPRRRALGDDAPKPAKLECAPELQLDDDHPAAPSCPPVFTPTNANLWAQCWATDTATPLEHHDFFRICECPPQKVRSGTHSSEHRAPVTSHDELNHLSSRPYSLRVSDPADFASAWETSIIPLLTDLLQKLCTCDFAVDVHNFPEMSSDAVPRVIYITLSGGSDADTSDLEQSISAELRRLVPDRFNPVYLKFRRGVMRRSWWGTQGERDFVCEPKNVTFRDRPVIGMSIGPVKVEDAASLGGFVRCGATLYAMSAFHAFEDSLKTCQLQVCHPATPDLERIVPQDPRAKPYSIGTLAMWSAPGTFRPSLTFQGTNFPRELTLVEMDCFRMDRAFAVEHAAAVEGNTEVYALARTSGYSLGFTSDVPGLQRISGQLRREWTVRQYAPFAPTKDGHVDPPWQTLKQWVTSGIGVPGDSGAWLIRRSDNALMGLIWGRNHDQGDPIERVRLTYFTPIVDVLVDVQEKLTGDDRATLPAYSAGDLARNVDVRGSHEVVQLDVSGDPWTTHTRDAIRQHRQNQADLIRGRFPGHEPPVPELEIEEDEEAEEAPPADDRQTARPSTAASSVNSVLAASAPTTPPRSASSGSMAGLDADAQLLLGMQLTPASDQSMPGLSSSSSINSGWSTADETSEVASAGVRVVGEDAEIADVEEPIRVKASFTPRYPGLLALNHAPLPL
ncbi:uncharacterized protein THITE_2143328 [Thermothielavioides terrestris NRRL 8126]|uniref:Uncharacterized protein n=1 Tax=Thermothielavioides terrestris (strain ATCC 38088 / NRRL 8126) TaxID=578455 RepID=G2R0V6_THETT|nr:uncharacterized protein THITE_2143328 [Thermothielavioides terrestris NRRL 8126]AEO65650.1 hypothetical protein THITE_2143328 [Thermothielavioides terrestris NRRL 8126]